MNLILNIVKPVAIILSIVLLLVSSISCSSNESECKKLGLERVKFNSSLELKEYQEQADFNSNPERLNSVGVYYLENKEYESGAEYMLQLHSMDSNNEELKAISAYYLMRIYYDSKQVDSLRKYLDYTLQHIDNSILSEKRKVGIYSVAAVYDVTTDLDYASALHNFEQAYYVAERIRDSIDMSRMLINISELYIIRKDTTGLKYAKKAFKISKDAKIKESEIYAVITLSNIYIIKGEYDDAYNTTKSYIDNLDSIPNEIKAPLMLSYASILENLGKREEASIYYKEAKDYSRYSDMSGSINAVVLYANNLLAHYCYEKAINEYMRAVEMSDVYQNVEYNHLIFLGLAEAYSHLGNLKLTSEYLQKYKESLATVNSYKKESDFRNLLLQNQKDRHQHQMQIAELDLEVKRRTNYIYALVVVILFGSVVIALVLYKKQRANYKNTVIQYEQFRQAIKDKDTIEIQKREQKTNEKFKIFEKLEHLMKQDKLYMDKNLSTNTLCSMLATNATDLSTVVNKFSNMSIPNYINYYRIQYVVGELSNKDNTESLNVIYDTAGFSSKTTFLRSFKKEIGCTPSIYREEVHKI